jgi:CO/xanthine dehydrogenase Mo-binding subunit
MGQGLHTSIKAAVADQIGCSRDDVVPVTGDTMLAPDSGSTTASRGGYVVWRVAKEAGAALGADILAAAAIVLDRSPEELEIIPGGIGDRLSNSGELLLSFAALAASMLPDALPVAAIEFQFPRNDYSAGNARFIFAYGACLARVAVNRVTGMVRVLNLAQHTAAGPIIDVAAYLGQMEGGLVQGLGFTLTEDAMMRDGLYQTQNLDTYMLPGIRDTAAAITVLALEDLDAGDTLGPRGAGELGIGAITPALANAVANAIGYLPTAIPFLPEAMLDALGGRL